MIIIGAGPAGLAAALRLKQQNDISSTIYEIRSIPSTLGGAIGIPCNGVRLLDRLGVYQALVGRATMTKAMILYSSQGKELGEIELGAWSTAKTGYGYMRVKRTDLQDVLVDSVQKEGIQIHYGKVLSAVEENESGVTVTFSDGTTDTADLLLGCDGIHSSVRKLYVDPQVSPQYSGLSTIYSLLPVSILTPSTWPPEDRSNRVTLTQDGLFAVLPCTASGDTIFWFFAYELPAPDSGNINSRDGWEAHNRREVDGFKHLLLNILRDMHGEWGDAFKNIVDSTETVQFYPIFRLPLGGKWSRGRRCLLLGDAAHAMMPHVGQGVSMALEDVFLLSRLLSSAHSASSSTDMALDSMFETFDQMRRPRVENFSKRAAAKGEERKRTGAWTQWGREVVLWASLWLLKSIGVFKWGIGETDLVYDICEVQIYN